MIKNKLYPYIEKYINDYLWGFSKEQLNVGLMNGTFNLEKLNIRIDKVNQKLDERDFPLWLKSGSINKIQVCCSLMNFIGEKPLEITIDNIDIILCPSSKWLLRNLNSFIKENEIHLQEKYDPLDNNFHDIFNKKLNIYDGSILKNKKKLIEFFKDKSKVSDILNFLLNIGIKFYYTKSYLINLKVKNIHLRFEDDLNYHMYLKPGLMEQVENLNQEGNKSSYKNKIALGITVQDLELNLSADGNVKKNNFKIENLNVYSQLNAEIYIPIKIFFENLDNDLNINEKYYELLKNNLVDFKKIINNFVILPSNQSNSADANNKLPKNLYFKCNKIIENLNFMGNFGINTTDKANIDFFSKQREKNYKFYFQIATNDIKIELNDFIFSYLKNLLETMRSVHIIDTIQEFKPMRKPYKIKENYIQKLLKEERFLDNFNKKRKLVVRDWLHYMIWFNRFKKAVYGILDNNLLQDEFSRYYNICFNNNFNGNLDSFNLMNNLESIKSINNVNTTNDILNMENYEKNLKSEINPEDINIVFYSEILIKSVSLKMLKSFEKSQKISINNIENHMLRENGVFININSIEKKIFLAKDDFSFTVSLKNVSLDPEKNKIIINKNLEEKIISKNEALKAININSTSVVYKKNINALSMNNIDNNGYNNYEDNNKKNELVISNSKSRMNSTNTNNSVPNLKITINPSIAHSNSNFDDKKNNNNNNINNNKKDSGKKNTINDNNNNNNINNSNNNNENIRYKKKLLVIDEVLENSGIVNNPFSNHNNANSGKINDEESFREIKTKGFLNNSNLISKNGFDNNTKRGNIVDMLLEKENDKKPNKNNISIPVPGIINSVVNNYNDNLYKNIDSNRNGLNSLSKIENKEIIDNKANSIKLVLNQEKQINDHDKNFKININLNTSNLSLNGNSNKNILSFTDNNLIRVNSNKAYLNNNDLNSKLKNSSNKHITSIDPNLNNETINLIEEKIAYIKAENISNSIKTNNFQDVFKSKENNHFDANKLDSNLNSISKLLFFEINKIKKNTNNTEYNYDKYCFHFSYKKKITKPKNDSKNNSTEVKNELHTYNDKLNIIIGDFIFNISNNSIKELKEISQEILNIRKFNIERIKNSYFFYNLNLEKDLYELRIQIIQKLESVDKGSYAENLKLDKPRQSLSNTDFNKAEINNYVKFLKGETETIEKKFINNTIYDFRLNQVFDKLNQKSCEIEFCISNISIFSYITEMNQKNAVNDYSINNKSHFLVSRSKIPQIYFYLFYQSETFILKFLEYEYEFYNKDSIKKIDFTEFFDLMKTKYDLLKHPINKQLYSLADWDNDKNNSNSSNNINNSNTNILNATAKKFENNSSRHTNEIFSKIKNNSNNNPDKIRNLSDNLNNNINFINIYENNFDSNFKHKSIINNSKNKKNSKIFNNENNILEESIQNKLNTTKKIINKTTSNNHENKNCENINNSYEDISFDSPDSENINNNINSINKIISINVSNTNNSTKKNQISAGNANHINSKDDKKELLYDINSSVLNTIKKQKDDFKGYDYYNNIEKINLNKNNTISESSKKNNIPKNNENLTTYDSTVRNSNLGNEMKNPFNKYNNNTQNNRNKQDYQKFDNKIEVQNYDYNSLKDLDEIITPSEALNDIYVNKKLFDNNANKKIQSLNDNLKHTNLKNTIKNDFNSNNAISEELTKSNKLQNNFNNNNSSVQSNTYSILNAKHDSLKNINNSVNNQSNSNNKNFSDKNIEQIKNKNSSNNTINIDIRSSSNLFGEKIINTPSSGINLQHVDTKSNFNSNKRNQVKAPITNKKKEEIHELLNQYKIDSKPNQTKIATLKAKPRPSNK